MVQQALDVPGTRDERRSAAVRAAGVVAGLVVVTSALASAAVGASSPVFSGDEVGPLLMAQHIAGGGSPTLVGDAYYAGWPVLISPLWWVVDDPVRIYRAVILSQVVVGLLGSVALVVLCRALGASPGWALVVATAVSITPSRVFAAGYALPQMTAGTLVLWLAAVLALDDARRRRWFLGVVLALVVLLVLVHPRFAPLAPAVAVHALLRARGLSAAGRGRTLAALGAGAGVLAVAWWLSQRVARAVFPGTRPAGAGLGGLSDLLNPAGAGVALGHVWYGAVAFGGVSVLGCCVAASMAAVGLARGRGGVHLVLLVGLAGVLLLGLLQVGRLALDGVRLDYWVYGRYAEPLWLALATVGLVAVARGCSVRLRAAAAVSFALVVGLAGLVLEPKPVSTASYVPLNTSALAAWPWSDSQVGGIPWGPASAVAACVLLVLLAVGGTGGRWRAGVVVAGTCALLGVVVTAQRSAFDEFDFLYRTDGTALHEPVLASVPAEVVLDTETVGQVSGNLYAWHLSDRPVRPVRGSAVGPDDLGADTWVIAGTERPGWLPVGSERVVRDNYTGETLWLTPGALLDDLAPRLRPTGSCELAVDVLPGSVAGPPGARVRMVVTVANTGDGRVLVDDSPEAVQLRLVWPAGDGDPTAVLALPRDLLLEDTLQVQVLADVPPGTPAGAGSLRVQVVRADGAPCGATSVVDVALDVAP